MRPSHLTHELVQVPALRKVYGAVEDLPEAQVEGMTTHEKRIFLAAWNAAYDTYEGDEGKAFAVAHAAVNRSREKRG